MDKRDGREETEENKINSEEEKLLIFFLFSFDD